MKPPNFVRCRPVGTTILGALGVGLAIFIAVIAVTSPTHDTATELILSAVIGVPSLLALLWSLWAQVIADERGLRWRLGWRWKQVSWEEVTDYYKQVGRKADWSVIETRQRNIRLREGHWNNLRKLQDIVQRKATNARTTEWAIYGTRSCDLPREFQYDERRIRKLLQGSWLALVSPIMVIAYLLVKALPAKNLPHFYWWFLEAALVIIAFGGLPLILLSVSMRELARDGRRRFHHRITVTADGIIFDDGEKRIQARWDEVTDYFVAHFGGWIKLPVRYVVVTEKGSFDFTTMLEDHKVLKRLIEQNARNASVKGWRMERGAIK